MWGPSYFGQPPQLQESPITIQQQPIQEDAYYNNTAAYYNYPTSSYQQRPMLPQQQPPQPQTSTFNDRMMYSVPIQQYWWDNAYNNYPSQSAPTPNSGSFPQLQYYRKRK